MKHSSISLCAWIALASSAPAHLLAQNPAPPSPQGGQTGGQTGGQQGGQQGGQTGGQQGTPQTGAPGQNQAPKAQIDGRVGAGGLHLQPGEELMGRQLEQRTGNQLGRVNDYVIRSNGSIAYVVLDAPGADTGSAHYPIPWSQLQFDTLHHDATQSPSGGADKKGLDSKGRYVAQFEGDRLKGAPSFDGTKWPRDNRAFDDSDTYYGTGLRRGEGGAARPAGTGTDAGDRGVGTTPASAQSDMRFRGSQFKEQVVVDSTGAPIGKIGRVAIDPVQGRVNYVTVSLSNVAGASGRTIAVPWSALNPMRSGETTQLRLNLPADKLQNAPQFKSGTADWAEMSDPNWVRSVYGYYGVQPYWNSTGTEGPEGKQPGTSGPTPAGQTPPSEQPRR